jgi:magnesium-transporting ATPase (P-type)
MDSIHWHSLTIEETLKQIAAAVDGLTSAEVVTRLAHYGRNEIARRKPSSPWRLLLNVSSG